MVLLIEKGKRHSYFANIAHCPANEKFFKINVLYCKKMI